MYVTFDLVIFEKNTTHFLHLSSLQLVQDNLFQIPSHAQLNLLSYKEFHKFKCNFFLRG